MKYKRKHMWEGRTTTREEVTDITTLLSQTVYNVEFKKKMDFRKNIEFQRKPITNLYDCSIVLGL